MGDYPTYMLDYRTCRWDYSTYMLDYWTCKCDYPTCFLDYRRCTHDYLMHSLIITYIYMIILHWLHIIPYMHCIIIHRSANVPGVPRNWERKIQARLMAVPAVAGCRYWPSSSIKFDIKGWRHTRHFKRCMYEIPRDFIKQIGCIYVIIWCRCRIITLYVG